MKSLVAATVTTVAVLSLVLLAAYVYLFFVENNLASQGGALNDYSRECIHSYLDLGYFLVNFLPLVSVAIISVLSGTGAGLYAERSGRSERRQQITARQVAGFIAIFGFGCLGSFVVFGARFACSVS